ncbi:hypothetical protein B0A49_06266, partial [Cryomyces minteri]
PWVGLLGFSQGAKLAASLLYEQQIQMEKLGKADTDYKFAVLLAGRSPLVSFSELSKSPATVAAGAISEGFFYDGDNGLHLHRRLLNQYCDPASVTLIEWDGTHRVPLKKTDIDKIVAPIIKVAKETGAYIQL